MYYKINNKILKNNKGYFVLQSLLDVLSSIFNRFALLDGNVSMEKLINDRKIVHK